MAKRSFYVPLTISQPHFSTPFSFLLTRLPTYHLIICLHLVPNYPLSIDLLFVTKRWFSNPTPKPTHIANDFSLLLGDDPHPSSDVGPVFFFSWWNFAKLRPAEKYDFDLHKDFPWKKMAQIRQISKKNFRLPSFNDKF